MSDVANNTRAVQLALLRIFTVFQYVSFVRSIESLCVLWYFLSFSHDKWCYSNFTAIHHLMLLTT